MKINEVTLGMKVNSPRNGEGMVIAKTKRIITVQFRNGNKCKNSYRTDDAYFFMSDF